jgi:arylsulfatase A-like enzyme
MELLTTTIRDQGEQLSVAEIKETNEIKQESGLFSSIVQENKQIAALKVSLSSQERKKLNVVIYVLESTSAHYLGFKNPEFKHLTPNLNRIAEQALILNQHYTHEPASLKVRYALLRGKYTSATRNWSKFVAQVKKEITLGEILGNNGYQTLYLSAGDLSMHGEDTMLKGRFQKILDRKYLKEAYPDLKNFDMGIDDRAVAYEFEKYLKAAQKPFLAVLTPMNPHHPYDVPDPKYLLYKERKWWERYKNSLYYSDSVIGMVYESLVRQGKDKDTVFIIVSDHGEAFYQHPKNYAHAIYLYEENVFTVCLWSNPLLFAKKIVYDHPTSHVDITPSILDLLEITYPQDYDGNSIFQSHPANLALFYTTYGDFYYGLRDGPWKYIFNKSYGVSELYHLEDDPWEKNDLSTQNPELVAKFKERISRISRKIY